MSEAYVCVFCGAVRGSDGKIPHSLDCSVNSPALVKARLERIKEATATDDEGDAHEG